MTWVLDGIFAAGGEHLPATWDSFADQTGISAVVHLRPERPATFTGPAPGAFLWLNLEDETQADMEARWLVAEFVGDCLEDGRRVLLHSSISRHRVRWIFTAYRIWGGRRVSAVLREVEERPWLAPYHTDVDAWNAFCEFVKIQKSDRQITANE
ncbi:MAG: hypothetical protein GTO18_04370 [Anaerolineales bacterium]|nr:hypothetical protein [Anaerolineales bacterium]